MTGLEIAAIIKAGTLVFQGVTTALGANKEKNFAASATRVAQEENRQAEKRLEQNAYENLTINQRAMVDQISGISSRLSAYGMGSGDQRGAQALALRAMTQANKDIRDVETDVINRIAKIDQAVAEEESAISGELARMDLAKGKQQAQIANQARRRQQAYTQQLVNLGGQAVALGIEELGPGLEDKMETKAAMKELDEAFQDDTAELAYFQNVADSLGTYNPDNPTEFLENINVQNNTALAEVFADQGFAESFNEFAQSQGIGITDKEALDQFLRDNLSPEQLRSIAAGIQ